MSQAAVQHQTPVLARQMTTSSQEPWQHQSAERTGNPGFGVSTQLEQRNYPNQLQGGQPGGSSYGMVPQQWQ